MVKSHTEPTQSHFQPDPNRVELNEHVQRLQAAVKTRLDAGMSLAQIGKVAGISEGTLRAYLKGDEWKLGNAESLASACGTDLRWLLFGESGPPPIDDDASIPFYDVEASAGFGRLASDAAPSEKFRVSRSFLRELDLPPSQTIALRVSGDSMEPTLMTGDRILVNTSPMGTLHGLTVLVLHGQLMVKRLAVTAEGVQVISDNDRYPPSTADIQKFRWGQPDGDDAITVIGRVAYRLQALS